MTEHVTEEAIRRFGASPAWRLARAPYRFCPVGAHVDHQGGRVTGFALDRSIHLAFRPTDDARVTVWSRDEPEPVVFRLDAVPERRPGDWGNYVRGAARALGARTRLRRGFTGLVGGEMSPGGVSSSAALGVACLLALEVVNDLALEAADNVELDRVIENEYLGLRNGILDPSVILHAKHGELLHVDCDSGAVASYAPPAGVEEKLALLAVYSGLRSSLVSTRFNERVAECESAATELLRHAGRSLSRAPRLGDVTREEFERHHEKLDPLPRRRAEHFFGEADRVLRGVDAWRAGDLEQLGRIVSETCESSIDRYECGAPELVFLAREMQRLPGVHGARFSGAGFRGYVVGLVEPQAAGAIEATIRERYRAAYPELARASHSHICRTASGAEVLPSPR